MVYHGPQALSCHALPAPMPSCFIIFLLTPYPSAMLLFFHLGYSKLVLPIRASALSSVWNVLPPHLQVVGSFLSRSLGTFHDYPVL